MIAIAKVATVEQIISFTSKTFLLREGLQVTPLLPAPISLFLRTLSCICKLLDLGLLDLFLCYCTVIKTWNRSIIQFSSLSHNTCFIYPPQPSQGNEGLSTKACHEKRATCFFASPCYNVRSVRPSVRHARLCRSSFSFVTNPLVILHHHTFFAPLASVSHLHPSSAHPNTTCPGTTCTHSPSAADHGDAAAAAVAAVSSPPSAWAAYPCPSSWTSPSRGRGP